jgi:hypothetical protein
VTRAVKPEATRACRICGDTIWVGHLFDLLPASEALTRADSVLARHEEMCRRMAGTG